MTSKTKSAKVCSPHVLAASTLSSFAAALNGPELPSFVSDSLGPRQQPISNSSMRLTPRDIAIIQLVARCRVLTADQIQVALFSPGGASRAQRRLTLLVRNHYLDRLPRQNVNEPAVYLLTRRSVLGNRIVKSSGGEAIFRRHMTKLGSVPHLLGINEVRVRVEQACQELGGTLRQWLMAEDLVRRMPKAALIPDAYFSIEHPKDSQVFSYFMEFERVYKTIQVVRRKLSHYIDLLGQSPQQNNRLLQVLFVFDDASSRRVEEANKQAARIRASFARFVAIDQLKRLIPSACLTEAVWLAPGHDAPVTLFPGGG